MEYLGLLMPSQLHKQGARMEMEQLVLELALMCDAGIAQGSLKLLYHSVCPSLTSTFVVRTYIIPRHRVGHIWKLDNLKLSSCVGLT